MADKYVNLSDIIETLEHEWGYEGMREDLEKLPTADVVEIVRCKDCKHATFYSCKNDACYKAIICEYKIGIGDENFYCACAEPRTPKERGGD